MDLTSSEPQPIHPAVRSVWRAMALGALGGAALVTSVGLGITLDWLLGVVAGTAIASSGSLVALRWTAVAHRRWRVTLTDRALVLDHGVIWQVRSLVPYSRLQHVDVLQGPIESRLGLARIKLHTASASSDAEIPGIAADSADALRDLLLERSGTTDAV